MAASPEDVGDAEIAADDDGLDVVGVDGPACGGPDDEALDVVAGADGAGDIEAAELGEVDIPVEVEAGVAEEVGADAGVAEGGRCRWRGCGSR